MMGRLTDTGRLYLVEEQRLSLNMVTVAHTRS